MADKGEMKLFNIRWQIYLDHAEHLDINEFKKVVELFLNTIGVQFIKDHSDRYLFNYCDSIITEDYINDESNI